MRKFLTIIAACIAFSSCEFDFSGNGNLDGFWQMTTVDTLATGGRQDMREERIYWSVQKKLLEVRQIPEQYYGVLFHFEHSNDRLMLREPYFNLREQGDVEVTNVEDLAKYGINALADTFDILELNDDVMTLQSKTLKLKFRRY